MIDPNHLIDAVMFIASFDSADQRPNIKIWNDGRGFKRNYKKMTKIKPVDMDLLRADIFLLNSVEQLSKSSLDN